MKTAPNKRKPLFSSTTKMKRMDDGGAAAAAPNPWQQANMWATDNQQGISAVGNYGSAIVNDIAPADSYGVKSNGAAIGGGALKGAASGAAIGSVIPGVGTIIGAGVGAVVGGVTGLIGNKHAQKLKTQAVNQSMKSQLQGDQQAADARLAGDPSLKYGRMAASYYRFGGVMKNSPATLPRTNKPLPAVQPAQRLMPNITESPNRQMSRMGDGGFTGAPMGQFGGLPNAIHNNATKLFRPTHTLRAQKNQILKHGGNIHPKGMRESAVNIPQVSRNPPIPTAHATQMPSASQPQPQQQQMDPNQIAQMQQMMQQQGGMQQKANGGSIHINPANKGKFNATKAATGKSTEELTHSSNPVTKKRAIFAQNASHWNKKANGGQVEQLSSQDALVNGPSHENGGVKFPSAGVELEGGETVNNGFVFSKKLGFAKPAATIARQLGKAEQRPESLINNSTIDALQRKTELLKVQQEAAKQAVGIPSDLPKMAVGGSILGDPIDGGKPKPKTKVDPTKQIIYPTYDPSLLGTDGKFNVEKADGSIGQWGNSIPTVNQPVVLPQKPVIPISDKAAGLSSGYYPAIQQQVGKDIPTQYPSRRFKFGGNMKKMDDGGPVSNPWLSSPVLNAVNNYAIQNGALGVTATRLPKPTIATAAPDPVTGLPANTKTSTFNQVGGEVSPFLSNFVNATQKLPLPPVPQLNTEITPSLVDYSASRNEAVRSARSADASARVNLNSGAAVSATKAANLAGQTRAVSQINEAENNQNSAIRNSAAAENAQIRAGNTALQNNYQNELVQRNVKSQALQSANMANLEEKVQGMSKDKKLFDQEGEKTILGFLQNNDSGAGYDAARPILQKHLSPDQLSQMDTWASKMRADRASERADNMKNNKLQLDYLKNNKSTTGVLNGASAVTSGKLKRNGTETDTDREGNRTIKRTTALYN